MNFLKIAGRDIKEIFKNRFVRVSAIAIIIVPLLYSLLYLYAFWDPYSKLGDMPVAVVNLDKGTQKDGEKVNYGQEIVDKLKENDKIGWRFVSYEEAQEGLKGKKGYYSMFVLPEDFSSSILSAKDGKPTQPKIVYSSNDKKNFLASQINGKVELELKDEIIKNITKEYTEVTFQSLVDVKDGLQKASDGSKKLYDGITEAKDGSEKLTEGIKKVKDKTPEMQDGVQKLYDGASKLAEGINSNSVDANGNPTGLVGGINKISDGSYKLSEGAAFAKDGADKLNLGANKLYNGLKAQLFPGVSSLNAGAKALSDGLAQAKDGADKLTLGAVGDGTPKNPGLINAANALNNGALQVSEGSKKLVEGASQLKEKSSQIKGASSQLSTKTDELSKGYDKFYTGIKDGSQGVANGAKQVEAGVNKLVKSVGTSQAVLNNSVENNLKKYIADHPEAMLDPNMKAFIDTLNKLNNTSNADDVKLLIGGVSKLSNGASDLNTSINNYGSQIQVGMNKLENEGIKPFTEGVNKYVDGTLQLCDGANKLGTGAKQFGDGAVKYSQASDQFAKGAKQFAVGTKEAVIGSSKLSDGINSVYNQLDENNDGSFGNGLKQVSQGTSALGSGLNQLQAGALQLSDGSNKLSKGIGALGDGSNQLKDGLYKFNSSIPELVDGANQLYDGSSKLDEGLQKLKDGSCELSGKLKDASGEINSKLVNSPKDMANFVSSPVEMNEKPINPINNYGTGFAPYFIALSLWVGAIMMFFIISDKVENEENFSSASVVVGKFLSYGFIGVLQAVLVSVIVMAIGLKPNNVLLYFLFNIFTSFVFIAIIQCLIFLLGQAGRLLSIVLLILQLTSCAGTFPLEVVPKFFKVLYPFMPFTYCISASREIISGSDMSVVAGSAGILAAIFVVFLVISIVMKGHAAKLQSAIKERKEATV